MKALDHPSILAELLAEWLPTAKPQDREETEQLLSTLVLYWTRDLQTAAPASPEVVNEIQREELSKQTRGKDAAGRLTALRTLVLRRKLNALSRASFKLGQEVLDGKVDPATARARAEPILSEVESLRPQIDAQADPNFVVGLKRELSDVILEAYFAIERKAMSLRLADYERSLRQPGH
jgi:hypothetical protein